MLVDTMQRNLKELPMIKRRKNQSGSLLLSRGYKNKWLHWFCYYSKYAKYGGSQFSKFLKYLTNIGQYLTKLQLSEIKQIFDNPL